MNAKSMPKTLTIKQWSDQAISQLLDLKIITASLDTELILGNILEVERTFLHAHPEHIISTKQVKLANSMLKKRLKFMPIPYILKYKEFYGRKFFTDRAVLIPRPESENIIDIVKSICKKLDLKNGDIVLADIGTGSGCLGITAKLEVPRLNVIVSDISISALTVATFNAKQIGAEITVTKSNLLDNHNERPDIIVANLPYVDKDWETSPETAHEPSSALFAADGGMKLIKALIRQSCKLQRPSSHLILEADPRQHITLIAYAKKYGYVHCATNDFIIHLQLTD
ncbi:MAG: peptide chain release factor N(5)-glutamine methyltransferase [Candidatus Saccharibacteria bacterium]